MAKTGADPDRRESFDFYQLLRAVESRIMATENAKRMDVLLEEDPLNIQLIQELRQQRPGVHGGALTQQKSPATDQEMGEMVGQLRSQKLSKTEPAVATRLILLLDQIQMDPRKFITLTNQAAAQGPVQGYSLVLKYKDWQNT